VSLRPCLRRLCPGALPRGGRGHGSNGGREALGGKRRGGLQRGPVRLGAFFPKKLRRGGSNGFLTLKSILAYTKSNSKYLKPQKSK